jgi:hypothetical protein
MWRSKFFILLIPFILLFGQDKDQILFPHQLHIEDVELSCEECHTGVVDADGSSWDIFPKMDYCAECHEDNTDDGDCSFCHTNGENPQSYNIYWKSSDLGFSHKKHLAGSEDCSKCHNYINDDSEVGLPNVWDITDCQTCHSKMEDGPSSHDLLWKEFHGSEMNGSTRGDCSLCHTNNSCEECHQLQQFTPIVHPNDFILSHSFEAKLGIVECTTCHEIVEDCYSCHVSNQVMPMNHNFHDWVNSDGGIHVDFVESEGELCATCHLPSEDSSCLQCHLGD